MQRERPDERRHGAEAAVVLLVLLAALLVRVPTLHQPLLEAHQFRQTQTAFTTLMYLEEGIDLLHPKMPVHGPPFETPFEFPLFQLAALVPASMGLPIDAAMRTTGLFFFLLTGLLLWGLVRTVRGKIAAIVCLILFLFMPHGILWGRTSMIEYLATAGAIGQVWAGIRWREGRRPALALISLIAGAVAMLTKVTTALFWVLPLIAYRTEKERGEHWGGWLRSRLDPVLISIVGLPIVLGALWTRHADAIKASNPVSAWLTSESLLASAYVGPWSQRFESWRWLLIADRFQDWITGFWPVLLLPMLILAAWNRQPIYWLAMGVVALLPIPLLFNAHVEHDYYQAALTPAIAAIVGAVFAWLYERLNSSAIKVAFIIVVAMWFSWVVYGSRGYWGLAYQAVSVDAREPLVAEIDSHIGEDDVPILEGYGWSPHISYYARRKSLMISVVPDSYLATLPGPDFRYLVADKLSARARTILENADWIGVLAAHTYLMGTDPSEMTDAPILATNETSTFSKDPGRPLTQRPIEVPCGAPATIIRRGTGNTWIKLADAPAGTLRLSSDFAPMPLRQLVVVRSSFPSESLAITCEGPPRITIESMLDVPEP